MDKPVSIYLVPVTALLFRWCYDCERHDSLLHLGSVFGDLPRKGSPASLFCSYDQRCTFLERLSPIFCPTNGIPLTRPNATIIRSRPLTKPKSKPTFNLVTAPTSHIILIQPVPACLRYGYRHRSHIAKELRPRQFQFPTPLEFPAVL